MISSRDNSLNIMIAEQQKKKREREIETTKTIIAQLERKYIALLSSKSKEDVEQRYAIMNEIEQHEKFIKDNTIQPTPDDFAASLPQLIRPMDRIGSASSIEKKHRERVEKMHKEVQDAIKKGDIKTEKEAVEIRCALLQTINNQRNKELEDLKRRKIVEEEDPTNAKRIEFLKNKLTEINTTIKSLDKERSKPKTGSSNVLSRGVKGFANMTGIRESSESKQRANINRLRSEARGISNELEIISGKRGGRKTKKMRRKTKKGRRKTRNCKP